MSVHQHLIAQLLNQRRSWVALGDGLKVRVLRPAEADMATVLSGSLIDAACQCVDGWDGFTEATLLPGVGASAQVEFDPELWRTVVSDRTEWIEPIVAHIRERVSQHIQAKAAAAKN